MTQSDRTSFLNINCSGNTITIQEKEIRTPRYCHSCDCIDGHACLLCEAEIDDADACRRRKGLCFGCWSKEDSQQ